MSVLNKLVTAMRAGLTEAGEAIADNQALRILDQELRDASEELNQTRESLASVMAQHKLSEEKLATLHASIQEHEGYAIKALGLNDEPLAHDVAEQIALLETEADLEGANVQRLAGSVAQLREAAERASHDIQLMKQQISTIRANESVQRAQAAVSARHSGMDSRLQTAKDSLARIQERQALQAHKLQAANELETENTTQSLEQRLRVAGIKPPSHSSEAVLERLRPKLATTDNSNRN